MNIDLTRNNLPVCPLCDGYTHIEPDTHVHGACCEVEEPLSAHVA